MNRQEEIELALRDVKELNKTMIIFGEQIEKLSNEASRLMDLLEYYFSGSAFGNPKKKEDKND